MWSADVPDVETLLGLVDSMPKLKVIKIDRLFVRRHGDVVFPALAERDIKVFNDAKLVEIPSKLEELALLEINRTDPWMLNCMAGSVSSGITEAEKRDDLDGLKR